MSEIQIDIMEMKQTIEQMKKTIEKLEKQVNDSYYDNVTIEAQYYNNVPPTCACNPYTDYGCGVIDTSHPKTKTCPYS